MSNQYLYVCDPKKNTVCRKTACHINGGPCSHTTNKQYKKAGTKRMPTDIIKRTEARKDGENTRRMGLYPENQEQ